MGNAKRNRGGTKTAAKRPMIVAIAAAAVIAVAAIVLWATLSGGSQQQSMAWPEARRDGVVAVIGKQDAPTVIDVYEDFLCPTCADFDQRYGEQLIQHAKEGSVAVRYHPVPKLSRASKPAGYSLNAANASLCAADAGEFGPYYDLLYDRQPQENTKAYDKKQLIAFGEEIGISDSRFADCVNNGTYDDTLKNEYAKFFQDPSLWTHHRDGSAGFMVPTVTVNGKLIDLADPEWLNKAAHRG